MLAVQPWLVAERPGYRPGPLAEVRLVGKQRLGLGDDDADRLESEGLDVPWRQPLFNDEAYFGERARTVPGTFGYEPRLDREHHPYP